MYLNQEIKCKLINHFSQGFKIGLTHIPPLPPPKNHPPVLELPDIAQAMVNDEVELKRVLGPYDTPPIPNLVCSPLNLVDKAGKRANTTSYII